MATMTSPEVYDSVKRWLVDLEVKSRSVDFSRSSTKRGYLYWLKRYCKFVGKSPDTLIEERSRQIKSHDEATVRKHEDEYVKPFIIYMKHEGYAPNSIATALGAIGSFYDSNYAILVKIPRPTPRNVKPSKVPSPTDLKKMCEIADTPTRTWICCQKDSGLSNIDLMSLNLRTLSNEFGMITTQLKKEIVPIHIQIPRQKTTQPTDSFFGPNAIEALEDYLDGRSRGNLFNMSVRTVQKAVKATAIKAKVATKKVPVTPHKLRTFFNNQMKYVAKMNEAVVERMMGHSIGRVRSAYMATGSDELMEGIPITHLAKLYMDAYHAIDIRKA